MNKTPVWHDPIVAEIHATRERFASQFQNNLAVYSKAAEAHCRALGFQVAESRRFATMLSRLLFMFSFELCVNEGSNNPSPNPLTANG